MCGSGVGRAHSGAGVRVSDPRAAADPRLGPRGAEPRVRDTGRPRPMEGGWRGGWQCGGGVWDGRCAPAVTSRHHRKPHHPWGPGGNTLKVGHSGPSNTVAFSKVTVGDTQQSWDHELYDHCRYVGCWLCWDIYLSTLTCCHESRLIACTEILLLSSSTFNQISPASKPLTQ